MERVRPEEIAELMRFVAEKTKNAEKLMSVHEMCRQFKIETGTSVTVNGLDHRIKKHRHKIHSMDEFDMDTKARMMIAVHAPVDDGFLVELRKEADVEVDDRQRIVRYETKGGSDGATSSFFVKRRRSAHTFGKRKRTRVVQDCSDDDEELMSNGEGTSNQEEQALIEWKAAFLFHNHADQQPPIDNEYEEKEQDVPVKTESLDEDLEVPATSVRDLLILLRGTLFSLESSHLNGIRRKIEAKIQMLSIFGDRQIPLKAINLQFDTSLYLLMKHACMKSEEESTSLRYFLCSLRTATCHLVDPSMDSFHANMKSYLEDMEVLNKKIPIKIVHNAMDAILNFIDP